MNIKKCFNILSNEQKNVISSEVNLIGEIVRSMQIDLYKKYDIDCEKWDLYQDTCKKCGDIENINIISQKLNSSTRQPKFIFQQPTSYSYTTRENITRCCKCGNEWIKISIYNRWAITSPKIEDYKFINVFMKNIDYTPTYEILFNDFNKPFVSFYAESIHKFFNHKIKLGKLRKKNKSIYD